jgi:hypothetical protein
LASSPVTKPRHRRLKDSEFEYNPTASTKLAIKKRIRRRRNRNTGHAIKDDEPKDKR